jgi:phosphopantothenoylcysteine decarboxylase/phosphopantothenate--cysteine ligase
MGYAVATVARDRGHEVILISGPVSIEPPNVQVIRVATAEQMFEAVDKNVDWCDAFVMAAAVADWRPASISNHKIKKAEAAPVIHLERTPDILKLVFAKKGNRLYVGFAAETENLVKEAWRKLKEKGLDLIVANDVSASDAGFEADKNRVILLARGGVSKALPLMPKREVAAYILDWLEEYAAFVIPSRP